MRKYMFAAMFGLFVGTVAGVAGAAEASVPGRCYREVSFNETADGSYVVRSAWRCEKTEVNRPVKGKVK